MAPWKAASRSLAGELEKSRGAARMIPLSWALGAVVVTALVAGGAGLKAGMGWVQGQWDRAKLEQTRADFRQSEINRAEEMRRTTEQMEALDVAKSEADAASADAAAAHDAAERLRGAYAAQLRRATTCHPTAAASSPPAQPTADLLADVQQRIDEAAGEIARFADRAHIAGRLCERDYDSLMPQQ